jgi:formamidopyrimidine-DNA glycosylase
VKKAMQLGALKVERCGFRLERDARSQRLELALRIIVSSGRSGDGDEKQNGGQDESVHVRMMGETPGFDKEFQWGARLYAHKAAAHDCADSPFAEVFAFQSARRACYRIMVPELPDITLYREALERRLTGEVLGGFTIRGPSLLKTVDPPPSALVGRRVLGIETIGKRLVFVFEGELFAVLHLMIAGRLHWKKPEASTAARTILCVWSFAAGTLVLTESSPRKRAGLSIVAGRDALAHHDPGGLDVFAIDEAEFRERLRLENHTLKRALTDPHLFSGIGNAYSDEILHRARLSPLLLTQRLDDAAIGKLFFAVQSVLREWIERLRTQAGDDFPERVTAFRPEMAVHGRFRKPCPDCGSPVQRIAYADSETNYCPVCQNEGRLLSDRALARLMHDDWPRTLAEMEEKRGRLSR